MADLLPECLYLEGIDSIKRNLREKAKKSLIKAVLYNPGNHRIRDGLACVALSQDRISQKHSSHLKLDSNSDYERRILTELNDESLD
jgi:hypothetical protein